MPSELIAVQLEGEAKPIARPTWLASFGILSFALLAATQTYAVLTSPPDRDMGNLEKILYVHVPAAEAAFMCFFVVFVASIAYLWRGREKDDLVAAAAAESGAVLTALTLVLGSIWGRPTWGVWWTWDARLTSTAVLLVVFAGYIVLRAFTDDQVRRARWSAAIGILGALNVPIVYMSVKWWRTLHQLQSPPGTMSRQYATGRYLTTIATLAVAVFFMLYRYHTARLERANEQLADADALASIDERTLEESYV
jgi:heme exporter protein C